MAPKDQANSLTLPISIINKTDVGRLLREAEKVDEFLSQAAIRQPGTNLILPKTTRALDDMVASNTINLLVKDDRRALLVFLNDLRDHAPQLHMSFSSEPSPIFLQKMMTYLRTNIHPTALLQVGLQPTIGAGFMLRTTNKYYDFSLRSTLNAKHDILTQKLRELSAMAAAKPAAEEVVA